MPVRLKYFAGAGVTVIAAVFIFASAYSRIVYVTDYARSMVIRVFGLYGSPGNTVSVISPDSCVKRIRPFRNMPQGMTHFAGVIFYRAPQNIRLHDLALNVIEYTEYYRLYELKETILSANRITHNIINAGEVILIGNAVPPYVPDNRAGMASRIPFVRGIYLTGDSAGSDGLISKLPMYREAGINAVVFDVKDITGIVHTKSRVAMVRDFNLDSQGAINNLPKLIRECRKNRMYVIARIAVFRDHLLYKNDPSCRIKSVKTGKEWNPGDKEKWCDPTSRKVQEYNIALACELADAGVDEVQFDYIRFPTVGDKNDADYAWSYGKMERVEAIASFLKNAHQELRKRNCFFSIDVFGVIAWGKDVDIKKTGQQINLLASNCDVISPMLYPSHFNDDFDGYSRPGDNPYYFIVTGCRKITELSGGKVMIRPWLQAFAWRISRYNSEYITEQVKAANDSGCYGYLFWNASNKYNEVIQAVKDIPAGK